MHVDFYVGIVYWQLFLFDGRAENTNSIPKPSSGTKDGTIPTCGLPVLVSELPKFSFLPESGIRIQVLMKSPPCHKNWR